MHLSGKGRPTADGDRHRPDYAGSGKVPGTKAGPDWDGANRGDANRDGVDGTVKAGAAEAGGGSDRGQRLPGAMRTGAACT